MGVRRFARQKRRREIRKREEGGKDVKREGREKRSEDKKRGARTKKTYLRKLSLKHINLIQKQDNRRPQEPSRIYHRLE
jgi:hypothetical protein